MIVSPDPLTRIGLRSIVNDRTGWKVTAEAGSVEDAVLRAVDLRPNLIIIDISFDGLNEIEPVSPLVRTFPASRVLVLDDRIGNTMSYLALRAGACGYIRKQISQTGLISAIEWALKGKLVFANVRDATLTERETRLLALVAEGATAHVAGAALGISHRTVEASLSNIRSKLGIREIALLVRYAVRYKIIDP